MLSVKNLINTILMITILVAGDPILARDCSDNPIYCTIIRIKSNINKNFAYILSNSIYKYSTKFETDPYRTVAILAQESMFRNIVSKEDYGLYQINIRTIANRGLDKLKLLEDIDYATFHHTKILRRKIDICKDKFEEPWACYHSMTPKYYTKYVKAVNRFYFKQPIEGE